MQLAYKFMWHGLEKRIVSIKWPRSSNHDQGELLKFSRSQSNAGYEGKQRNIRGCTTFWLSQNYMLKGPTKSCRSSDYERGARFIYNFKKIRNIHAVPSSRTHNSWPHHSLFFHEFMILILRQMMRCLHLLPWFFVEFSRFFYLRENFEISPHFSCTYDNFFAHHEIDW